MVKQLHRYNRVWVNSYDVCFQALFECERSVTNVTDVSLDTSVSCDMIVVVGAMVVALATRITSVPALFLMYVLHVLSQPTFLCKFHVALHARKTPGWVSILNVS